MNKSWICNFGRDYYTLPNKNRLTGCKANKKAVDYQKAVKEIATIFKEKANETAFVISSHATNEELTIAKQLVDESGIKGNNPIPPFGAGLFLSPYCGLR